VPLPQGKAFAQLIQAGGADLCFPEAAEWAPVAEKVVAAVVADHFHIPFNLASLCEKPVHKSGNGIQCSNLNQHLFQSFRGVANVQGPL
jgi:hypothetical protein